MIKTFIFSALAASLVFATQGLSVKVKEQTSPQPSLEKNADESDARIGECLKKDGSAEGNIKCINEELKIQDKILNETYKDALGVLSDENKKKLKEIQRKWVSYKEAKCSFIPFEGELYRVESADCYLRMTKVRIGELEHVIEIFKGNN
jgi:Uncharacterized protein conserved in bacteria